MIKLNFIASTNGQALTKTIKNGIITPYPNVWEVNSYEADITTPEELFTHIQLHADMGSALLKGQLDRPLRAESRSGRVLDLSTKLLVLDIDTHRGFNCRTSFLESMGLADVTHIFQHSSKSKHEWDIRGHYFFLLDKSAEPKAIKNWLKHKNIEVFSDQLELTSTDLGLKWPLDIGVNDNGKIIYIAPPILDGPDPIHSRITLRKRAHDRASINFDVEEVQIHELINNLRKKTGLGISKTPQQEKIIALKPGQMAITGLKKGIKYMYLNLNGGDSWGYYFRLDRPEIVRNFKNEPFYRLKDIDPQLYASLYRPPAIGGIP